MSLPLPPDKDFSDETVPAEVRQWFGPALVRPLNEFRRAVSALLAGGLGSSNLNEQVLTRVVRIGSGGTWPTDVEFYSTLKGRCLGVTVVRAVELDSSNADTTNALATWGLPTWQERSDSQGRAVLKLLSQSGPAASKSYRVTWIARGE